MSVNPAFTKLTGYTEEEVIGRSWMIARRLNLEGDS
ncbi:PAS domain S-box protein [Sporosarcina luteola]